MTRRGGWEAFRTRPGVRRIALVALLACLGAIAWFALSRSPVQADLEVHLEGEWPPISSVTLVYSELHDAQTLRQVRLFPTGPAKRITDRPHLTPGTYNLAVTVVTASGAREYVQSIEHERGARSRIDLRF